MKIYKLAAVLFLTIALLSGCSSGGNENANAQVDEPVSPDEIIVTSEQFAATEMQLGKITQQSFSDRIQISGITDVPPAYKAAVSVYFGGTVKDVQLLVGQSINKGDVLFTLENPDYVQMQQDYLTAKNRLSYLKAEYERQKELLKENVSSRKKFAKAESDYFSVLSEYNAMDKKLRLLNVNPEKLDYNSITSAVAVRAPIGGYVTQVNITKGQYLSPNSVAVAIVNTEHMHLELNVFEKDITKIKKGQSIRFSLPDDGSNYYEGEVFLVGQAVYSDDRTINVHGHLKNESGEKNFIPGMYIEAEILVDEIKRPALPSDAIVNAEDENYILVKKTFGNDKYSFIKKRVEIGKTNDGNTEILNADEFGDSEIVIKGAFNLIQ